MINPTFSLSLKGRCIGNRFLRESTGCFSSWQWQFTGVWTAAHRQTCRTTAFRPPVLTLGGTCVPQTVNYLQYLATGSTLTAVGPVQLPAPKSGTLSQISSRTRPSLQTVSDVCIKRTGSLDDKCIQRIGVLDDKRANYCKAGGLNSVCVCVYTCILCM